MKEVWYFLYRDYEVDDKVFSSTYYDTFEEAWNARKIMKEHRSSLGMPISPVMKGYMRDE